MRSIGGGKHQKVQEMGGLVDIYVHVRGTKGFRAHTLIPSFEKHGGTAELSSSASLSRIGKFSIALMGISPL